MAETRYRLVATRPGRNASGVTIVKGSLVKVKAAPTYADEIELCTAATDPILGVVIADIATGTTGAIQTHGTAQVLGAEAVAIGASVMPGLAGGGFSGTAANTDVGIANTLGAAATLFEVELGGPGNSRIRG